MSDVEDVFIGEEAELPKRVTIDVRPSKEEVELHNKTTFPIAVGVPTALGEKPGGEHAGEGGGRLEEEFPSFQ